MGESVENISSEVRKTEWGALQQPEVQTWNCGKIHERPHSHLEGDTFSFKTEIPLWFPGCLESLGFWWLIFWEQRIWFHDWRVVLQPWGSSSSVGRRYQDEVGSTSRKISFIYFPLIFSCKVGRQVTYRGLLLNLVPSTLLPLCHSCPDL